MALLQVSEISKEGNGDFVLQNITFSQRMLQKIAIAGETGSGKSTLLKIIAGLIQPDTGKVLLENVLVKGPADKLVPGHPGIAYLSQDFELPNSLRVEQVLSYANLLSDEQATALYEVCQISHLLNRRTDQLSGGERQRIALTKLLITSPKLLLLDEPFSNLDMILKATLKSVIHEIGKRLKITCILVSHDPLDTLSWADKILVMKDGRIIQHGAPEKIYRQPINEYVAGLFGKYNLIDLAAAKLFSKMVRMKLVKGKVVVRTENFKLVHKKKKALVGRITDSNFFGSFYESTIAIPGAIVIVRTNQATSAGTMVYLEISYKDVWYIKSL